MDHLGTKSEKPQSVRRNYQINTSNLFWILKNRP